MKAQASAMALAMAMLVATSASAGPAVAPIDGLWKNPSGSITVRIGRCGADLCGKIERATAAAEKDAREAGVPGLVGVELLRDYKQVSGDRWEGRVYVPDMGGTYSSHIVAVAPNQLKVSGCLIGGWLCKSQLWTRD